MIRIGSGAGYAGDRWEPAQELVEKGGLDYLVFECLAERTIALGQLERLRDPARGYNPFLEERFRAVLGPALDRGVKIVTNMGAANPPAAGEATLALARERGLDLTVAVVQGDDVTDAVATGDATFIEGEGSVADVRDRIVSANAYLGADVVRDALATGADVVITGRVADPSLFLGCMLHGHGWSYDDWGRIGQGTVVGHLLECAGQVTGGYFADPGIKEVPDLDRLGFPLAEVSGDGSAFITKVAGSGGLVTVATCREQLLYELHDPQAYVTPDCVADFAGVRLVQEGPDRVRVDGGTARPRTDTFKVSLCTRDGWIGEGHVAYAGPNALARAELAGRIVRSRIAQRRLPVDEMRVDLIGVDALHGPASTRGPEPYEVRLRVAGRTPDRRTAELLGQEVQSLLTNGPYGGAGDFLQVREVIGVRSLLWPRHAVRPEIRVLRQ
ncbi:MAG TPA: acyclic terpene utilization AtuA family protein [Azospirillaceae bacterium]|nr:acyclic terpene utilization AtuA family protein [Azospirillaceae bacterium]